MPEIEFFQSPWAVAVRQPGMAEPTIGEKFEMAAAAGSDGMCLDLGDADIGEIRVAAPLWRAARGATTSTAPDRVTDACRS